MDILSKKEPMPLTLLGGGDHLTTAPDITLPVIPSGDRAGGEGFNTNPILYITKNGSVEIHPEIPGEGTVGALCVPIDKGTILPVFGAIDTAAKAKIDAENDKQQNKGTSINLAHPSDAATKPEVFVCPVPSRLFDDKHPLQIGTRVECRYPGGRYYKGQVNQVNPINTNGAFDDNRNRGTWRKEHPDNLYNGFDLRDQKECPYWYEIKWDDGDQQHKFQPSYNMRFPKEQGMFGGRQGEEFPVHPFTPVLIAPSGSSGLGSNDDSSKAAAACVYGENEWLQTTTGWFRACEAVDLSKLFDPYEGYSSSSISGCSGGIDQILSPLMSMMESAHEDMLNEMCQGEGEGEGREGGCYKWSDDYHTISSLVSHLLTGLITESELFKHITEDDSRHNDGKQIRAEKRYRKACRDHQQGCLMDVALRILTLSSDLISRSHTILTTSLHHPWYNISQKDENKENSSRKVIAEAVACSPLVASLLPLCISLLTEGTKSNHGNCLQLLTKLLQGGIVSGIDDTLTGVIQKIGRLMEVSTAGIPPHEWEDNVILESQHPYQPNDIKTEKVKFGKHVSFMQVKFDSLCATIQPEDVVTLQTPSGDIASFAGSDAWLTRYGQGGALPRKSGESWMVIPGNELSITMESATVYIDDPKEEAKYGYKATVIGHASTGTQALQTVLERLTILASQVSTTASQMSPILYHPASNWEDVGFAESSGGFKVPLLTTLNPLQGKAKRGGITDPGDHRAALLALYQKRDPTKLGKIEAALEKYKGKEHAMWKILKKKYGDSDARPPPGFGVAKAVGEPATVNPAAGMFGAPPGGFGDSPPNMFGGAPNPAPAFGGPAPAAPAAPAAPGMFGGAAPAGYAFGGGGGGFGGAPAGNAVGVPIGGAVKLNKEDNLLRELPGGFGVAPPREKGAGDAGKLPATEELPDGSDASDLDDDSVRSAPSLPPVNPIAVLFSQGLGAGYENLRFDSNKGKTALNTGGGGGGEAHRAKALYFTCIGCFVLASLDTCLLLV